MGQAFDKDGQILGEMEANSMREVLDGLQQRHPAAHEIRIKQQIDEQEAKARDVMKPAPPSDRMLQFFAYSHLPEHLAKASLPFCQLAEEICATLPSNPERTVALRKLLEAKDCAVRALLFK